MKITKEIPALPRRAKDSHKGTYGNVFVLAGSIGMAGAAYLCASAVLRSGAGRVLVGVPKSLVYILAGKFTCEMLYPLPETERGTLSSGSEREILEVAHKHNVVAIGPGISRYSETNKLVLSILYRINNSMIIDADGLNIISEEIPILRSLKQPVVLTPHPGEMARLTGKTVTDVQKNREEISFEFAKKHKVILALKGSRTVVTDGINLYVNETGNPGMATAGSGDVLTGVIAGLMAQGMTGFDATRLGVYVHGLAGDIAVKDIGEMSLIASDILDYLPKAFVKTSNQ